MINFEHFKSGENEKFLFLQLPMLLIKDDMFKGISSDAKILYSLLLNRTSLSSKNGWIDDNGNIYIIYTIDQIMKDLNCWEQKAIKAMKELKEIGLVKSVRQGLGKPNITYVMNFSSVENPDNTLNCENHNSRIVKTTIQEPPKITIQELRKSQCSNIDNSNTNLSNIESESMSMSDDSIEIKNDMTRTPDISSKKETNMENNKSPVTLPSEATTYTADDYSKYEQTIKSNIDYDHYATYNHTDIEMIDGLVDIMLDVICTQAPNTIKIGKETKSRDIVKNAYLKLNSSHIEHIISQFKDQHHKITHKNAYLRTMLYTVGQEFDAHYTNQVRADGVIW